jgi:holo-[acyl-carrier protein] synthase
VILGLGIDLLDTRRVERELARGAWAIEDGAFTPGEIGRCNSAHRPARHYAACFAAKEATLKALGLQVDDSAMFREAEVEPGAGGGYRLILHGRLDARSRQLGVRQMTLSIACHPRLVVALVILGA